MLERLIRASLDHRLAVLLVAGLLLALGTAELARRPVDIFPDLNQPIVTVMADAHGLAPEEVETLITLPLESALAGAPGVERIRSISQEGLAIVRADFGWGTDLYRDRQLVQERLQLAREDLPPGVEMEMAPISSITGQILDLGLESPDESVSLMKLRTLADWVVRRRLLSVKGVSQVVVIGGDRKQYQVLANPDLLLRHGISMSQLAEAVRRSNANTSGGYLVEGSREMLVRNLGRVRGIKDLKNVVVAGERQRPVRVRDVARVQMAPEFPRGTASVDGRPGVVLSIFKQPDSDTLALTQELQEEIEQLRKTLPKGVVLRDDLFRQATFLDRGVDNVVDALRDGAILVVIVLLLFLMNLRATLITLVALPLSFATAGLLFSLFDMTLNTMTLGGLATAVGQLVDDAIVGVENVVRWLRKRRSPDDDIKCLVADASAEVRGPIFTGTLVVVLVFVPLFALSGVEGRLFSPLALAYVVSLLASLVVSLTVTPVLALLLFSRRGPAQSSPEPERPAPALRFLQQAAGSLIGYALRRRWRVLVGSVLLMAAAAVGSLTLGNQFLPEFDEGTVLVMTILPPGASLEVSDRVAREAEEALLGIPGVKATSRYTGRGEHDEHAPPVGISHLMLTLDTESSIPREEMLRRVRQRLRGLRGVSLNVGQPLAHRIDHLLSGVQAQIAIKVRGTDLGVMRDVARRVAAAADEVPGVTDLNIETQVLVPQAHVEAKRERLTEVGLSPGDLVRELEVAIGGEVVGQVLEGERAFDLFVRLDRPARASLAALRQLPVRLPAGGWARLGELARVRESVGPNRIKRDNMVRRIAISCNVSGRSIGEVVADLRRVLEPIEKTLPDDTSLRLEGQFQAQERAVRLISLLSLLSLALMIMILYGQFRSFNLSLQVLVCVPAAFIGGVGFMMLTGQSISVASLVGFVSLAGIATRNGILLVAHYLHLMRTEKAPASVALLVRAGRERAAPVVMTALTTGMGLLPLLLSAGETGREILYPIATVVVGGLITSTLFEFLLRPALFWVFGRRTAERLTNPGREC
ncbi:efflux RND transporter permease subunit [Myxococcota bacterium]